ncbi:MAG: sigma-70 family RNA polymerase sigma factor [Bacteroides sp.]|nr:sigma-70 family RNA polymerase sigma factor [Bacteroides sp.]MCM1549758.1 sigma-70 family RNA polymerase sigma factor [Clostridium sp.]
MDDKQIERLTVKAARGNAKAYGQLIEYYKEYLYRTAWLSMKDEEQALDVVGECILRGFRFIHTLKNPGYFKTWITRILLNAIQDYYGKNPKLESTEELYIAAPEASISSEEKMDLYQAIDRLPEKYKTVIVLKYFDEMKVSEIAYVMDIPEGSVKAYLSRARGELRKLLKEEYLYEDRISAYTSTRRIESGSGKEFTPGLLQREA